MKKAIRDAILIVIIFLAVLAAPFVIENFSDDTPPAPEEQSAPPPPQPRAEPPAETSGGGSGLPPQPVPADLRGESEATPRPPGGACALDEVPSGSARMQGNEGVNTYVHPGGGRIDYDSATLRSFERLSVRNGAANMVNVFASGLAMLGNGRALYIEGDPGIDTVTLDACLTWREAGRDPEGNTVFNAGDARGNSASVTVSPGVAVLR